MGLFLPARSGERAEADAFEVRLHITHWMHANGYPTIASWYSSVSVIGFTHEYMAYINGRWDLVLKAGA